MKKLNLNEMIALFSENIENRKEINLTSGLYTEENILSMLKSIAPTKENKLKENWESILSTQLYEMLEENITGEFIDYDDFELELNDKEISLYSVEILGYKVRDASEFFVSNLKELLFEEEDEQDEEITDEAI